MILIPISGCLDTSFTNVSMYTDYPALMGGANDYWKIEIPATLHITSIGENTDTGLRVRHYSSYHADIQFHQERNKNFGDFAPDAERVLRVNLQSQLFGLPPQKTGYHVAYTLNTDYDEYVNKDGIALRDPNVDIPNDWEPTLGKFSWQMPDQGYHMFYVIPLKVQINNYDGPVTLDNQELIIPYVVYFPRPGKDWNYEQDITLTLFVPFLSAIPHKCSIQLYSSGVQGWAYYYGIDLNPDNDIPVLGSLPVLSLVSSLVYTTYHWIKYGTKGSDFDVGYSDMISLGSKYYYKVG